MEKTSRLKKGIEKPSENVVFKKLLIPKLPGLGLDVEKGFFFLWEFGLQHAIQSDLVMYHMQQAVRCVMERHGKII